MQAITCILIDDEKANSEVLQSLLQRHCPELTILAEASSADDGYEIITRLKPALIFLDVKMPGKNGFDLLQMFTEIDFEVIFVTSYDQYAVPAFEFNALAYILKPIDYRKLILAVNKAVKTIQSKVHSGENIVHFVSSLNEKNELLNKITLHHNDKVMLLELKNISYIEARGDYSLIHTFEGEQFLSPKILKKYDELMEPQGGFMRINKSVLINLNFIKSYSKSSPCFITLKNNTEFQISRRKKTEIIEKLLK